MTGSAPVPAGRGLGTKVHVAPFQCMITLLSPFVPPTAHTSDADTAATPLRNTPPPVPAGRGDGVLDQALPSQCSTRACPAATPTAQASRPDTTASALKLPGELSGWSPAGVSTCVHARPSQCIVTGFVRSVVPAAQTFDAETAATAASSPPTISDPGGGCLVNGVGPALPVLPPPHGPALAGAPPRAVVPDATAPQAVSVPAATTAAATRATRYRGGVADSPVMLIVRVWAPPRRHASAGILTCV